MNTEEPYLSLDILDKMPIHVVGKWAGLISTIKKLDIGKVAKVKMRSMSDLTQARNTLSHRKDITVITRSYKNNDEICLYVQRVS